MQILILSFSKLAAALIEDQKEYPGASKTSLSMRTTLSAWQKDTRAIVREMASYVIESARDEDDADEEGGDPSSPNGWDTTPIHQSPGPVDPRMGEIGEQQLDEGQEEEPEPPAPPASDTAGDDSGRSPHSSSSPHGSKYSSVCLV